MTACLLPCRLCGCMTACLLPCLPMCGRVVACVCVQCGVLPVPRVPRHEQLLWARLRGTARPERVSVKGTVTVQAVHTMQCIVCSG